MEIIDHIVIILDVLLFSLWALDMFGRDGVFESPAAPTAIGASLTVIGGVYFLSEGTPWITGVTGFLAVGYLITAFALKGSK